MSLEYVLFHTSGLHGCTLIEAVCAYLERVVGASGKQSGDIDKHLFTYLVFVGECLGVDIHTYGAGSILEVYLLVDVACRVIGYDASADYHILSAGSSIYLIGVVAVVAPYHLLEVED